MLNRREFLSATAVACLGAPSLLRAQNRRPNILLILADDLGYGDLGCYGQKRIQTPNLDRLAAEGIRFTQAYAGSTVCAPSRCSLETGLHTGHARVRGNRYPAVPLRPEDTGVAEVLKSAGYRTGLIGKWALGELGSTGYPLRKGYDYFYGYFSQTHAHNYYPEHLLENWEARLLRGNMGTQRKDYSHDLFTEKALEFIRASDERPFFLQLAYTIPHANNELGRDTGNGMQVPDYGPYAAADWPEPEKGFAAMITRMDRDIGRILDTLKKTGQDENTIIFFTSDNGPHQEGGHKAEFFDSNGPLRGIKRDLYEGGIRVPAIVRWPGRIAPGQVSDFVWAFWDFLPTCAELAGIKPPPGLDGLSILPALLGKMERQQQHDHLYWEFHERGFQQAVRMGNWKAVRLGLDKPLELYDLSGDPGEQRDVASQHPGVVKEIERILASARTDSPYWPVRATRGTQAS